MGESEQYFGWRLPVGIPLAAQSLGEGLGQQPGLWSLYPC